MIYPTLVEECDGKLCGYGFDWKPKKVAAPKAWRGSYPDTSFEVVPQENFLEFLL